MMETNLVSMGFVPQANQALDTRITSDGWTSIQVDSQVLSLFMSCPQKFKYVFIDQLQQKEGLHKGIKRGTIVHDALLTYWKERIKTNDYQIASRDAMRLATEAFNKDISFDAEERLENMTILYEYLRYIQSSSWIPLEAEKFFRIKIYEDESAKLRIFIAGRIDLILRSPQLSVFPVDVKTESMKTFHSEMSNQFKLYCLACNVNVIGVQRICFQKDMETKDRFKLETIGFDPDVLEEFRTTTLPYWINRLIECYQSNYFPMQTTSCITGFFACQFSDKMKHKGICNVSRSIRDQKLNAYFVKGDKWDPSKLGEVEVD
jgi:PD-(D/E)XK nuclease superfamily